MFLFGRETKGLPKALLADNPDRTLRIPMLPDERLRSLNLANSANIVLYEALRQIGFPGLE
jgi:tRNA (cytidine/uridine-2'-O-)-methyltransferase